MRIPILAATAAALLAGCATQPPVQQRSAAAERQLQQLLAGKAPGQARSCLPYRSSSDMVIIDNRTVLFRDGARRVWRTEMRGPCQSLGTGAYTLVTRNFGSSGPCAGDIAQLVDMSSGMIAGTCVWGDFVPWERAGG